MSRCAPRRSWQSASTAPRYSDGTWIVARISGSSIALDARQVGQIRGRIDLDGLAGVEHDLVAHRRRRRDQVQAVLAFEPLLDDLRVQEAEEAAAEAEAERRARLGLVAERGVVEAQLLECRLQRVVLLGVDRVEPGEHHRLHFAETRQRRGSRPHARAVIVSPMRTSSSVLMPAITMPDLAGLERGNAARVRVDHVEVVAPRARSRVAISLTRSPSAMRPSTTRTSSTTPT